MVNSTHMTQPKQSIHLSDRHALTVSGTEDVISFDDSTVCLRTVYGDLHIDGNDLRIVSLNAGEEKGNILIEGEIAGLFFDDVAKHEKTGFFGRKRQ